MLRFIDLFSGIGGFHVALNQIGHAKCVFASEIDLEASKVYNFNHGITPFGDITEIAATEIPEFDLLCAGFPCQPFSKGGNQNGFDDTRGTLFFDIVRIINYHKPKYILLENVPNLVKHDSGNTYSTIINTLKKLGYHVPEKPLILSPHNIGIPVHRPRTFIPCTLDLKSIKQVNIEVPKFKYQHNYLQEFFNFPKLNSADLLLTKYETNVLQMWDEFYQGIEEEIIGFPIWYEVFKLKRINNKLPEWKKNIILKNINLYNKNRNFINDWEIKYDKLKWTVKTHRKFEWQCGKDCKSVFEGLIQFRPSGVRVKRLNYFSTLVAMNHPQIIGPLNRRLTTNETKLLQSFPENYILHEKRNVALKQLGNAVNVEVVKFILNQLIPQ